jgi:hypothetical protein
MKGSFWLTWNYAVKLTERRRGVSLGAAAKAVNDAIESGKLQSRPRPKTEPSQPFDEPIKGPDVLEADFLRWLNPPNRKSGKQPKQPRIIRYLADKFENKRVPDDYSRQRLKGDLLELDMSLSPLDLGTLKTAINKYNAGRAETI